MKSEIFLSKILLGLALLLIIPTVVSAAVKLPNRSISSSGTYSRTPSFAVTDTGELKVTVRVRVKGFFGSGGSSSYRVQLMRGNTVVDTETVVTNSSFANANLRYVLTNCHQTSSNYYIRMRNTSSVNPQPGEAQFVPFDPPRSVSKQYSMAQFGVVQGNRVNRDIPQYMEPEGSGGTLLITATWKSFCGFDLAGCRLIFILKRNGSQVAQANGYSLNSIPMKNKPKMRLGYSVPASQVGSNWSLEVRGSSSGNVQDVRPMVTFTPRCQQ